MDVNLNFHELSNKEYSIYLTMIDRGEPYMSMQGPAHKNPTTTIRRFPSIAKWVIKTASARNPTSKMATNSPVLT